MTFQKACVKSILTFTVFWNHNWTPASSFECPPPFKKRSTEDQSCITTINIDVFYLLFSVVNIWIPLITLAFLLRP